MATALKFDIEADFIGDKAFAQLRSAVAASEADMKRLAASTGSSLGGMNDNFKAASGSVSNIAAQFQDIGVQLAGGQSPFLIALQQGTQLGSVLGQTGGGIGGAVKALGAGFASLVNPINLAVIAGTALVGTFVQWATSSGRATTEIEDGLKSVESILNRIKTAYPDAFKGAIDAQRPSILRLGVDLDAAAVRAEKGWKRAADAMTADMKRVDLSVRGTQSIFAEFGVAAPETPYKALKKAVDDMRASMAAGKPDFDTYIATLQEIAQSDADSSVRRLAGEMLAGALRGEEMAGAVEKVRAAVGEMDAFLPGATKSLAAFNAAMGQMAKPIMGNADVEAAMEALDAQALVASGNARTMGQAMAVADQYGKKLREVAGIGVPMPQAKPNVMGFDPYKSGGGAAESEEKKFERAAAAIQKKTAALEAENAVYGQNATLQQADIAYQQALIGLKSQGVALTPERLAALDRETEALREQLRVQDELRQSSAQWQQFRSGFESVFGAVVNALESGSDALEAFRKSMLSLLLQSAQRRIVDSLFGPAGGGVGGVFGGLFGDLFRASGGPVSAGRPYIVGEQGPELFFPGKSGTIAPASATAEIGAMTRRSGSVSVVVNNTAGEVAQASARPRQGPDGQELIEVAVNRILASGKADKALNGRFGLGPKLTRR